MWEPMAALLRVLGATAAGEGRALAVAAVEGSVPRGDLRGARLRGRGGPWRSSARRRRRRGRARSRPRRCWRGFAPAPGARALAHPAAEEDAEPPAGDARLLLGGGAGAPIISAPVPRRSHHVLRNSRALDAAAVGGRAGAGLRRRRAL